MRRLLISLAVLSLAVLSTLSDTTVATAHADLESSVPVADSTVESAPLTLDLTFTEEVSTGGVTVRVLGPAGDDVTAGTAEVDLNDPERRHVTVSLQGGLEPGRYTVEWETTSNLDDHPETGSFAFTVAGPATDAASPAATPAGSPVGSPAATPDPAASSARTDAPEPTLDPDANGNPLASSEGDFDGRAFAISIGVGLTAAVGLVLFWRAVRPRDPVFGGRARS